MYVSYTIHMILRCFHPYFLGQIWILPGTWPSQWIVWRFCSSNWLQPLGTAGYRWMPVSRCLDNAHNSSIFLENMGKWWSIQGLGHMATRCSSIFSSAFGMSGAAELMEAVRDPGLARGKWTVLPEDFGGMISAFLCFWGGYHVIIIYNMSWCLMS